MAYDMPNEIYQSFAETLGRMRCNDNHQRMFFIIYCDEEG